MNSTQNTSWPPPKNQHEPAVKLLMAIEQDTGQQALARLRGETFTPRRTDDLIKEALKEIRFDFPLPALARRLNAVADTHPEASAHLDHLAQRLLQAEWVISPQEVTSGLFIARLLDQHNGELPDMPVISNAQSLMGALSTLITYAGQGWIQPHIHALSQISEHYAATQEQQGNRVLAQQIRVYIPTNLAKALPPHNHTPAYSWEAGRAAGEFARHYPLGREYNDDPLQIGGSELNLRPIWPETTDHQRTCEWWAGTYRTQGAAHTHIGTNPALFASVWFRQPPRADWGFQAASLIRGMDAKQQLHVSYSSNDGALSVFEKEGRVSMARWLLLLGALSHPQQRWKNLKAWKSPQNTGAHEEDDVTWQTQLNNLGQELIACGSEALRAASETGSEREAASERAFAQQILRCALHLSRKLSRELSVGNDTLESGCNLFDPGAVTALKTAQQQADRAQKLLEESS